MERVTQNKPILGIVDQLGNTDKFSFESPQLNVMDIASMRKSAIPIEIQQHLPDPRTKEQHKRLTPKSNNKGCNKTKNNSSASEGTHVVRHQLITGT